MMRYPIWIILPFLALAGCQPPAETPRSGPDLSPELIETASNAATAVTRAPAPRPAARSTVAQLDTTTPEQRAAAARPAQGAETMLGTTIASLGDATRPGLWIRTPLVSEPAMGRLRNPANGKSAQVELLPLDGPASGGSQVSLSALQLLEVPLTALPRLEVFRS